MLTHCRTGPKSALFLAGLLSCTTKPSTDPHAQDVKAPRPAASASARAAGGSAGEGAARSPAALREALSQRHWSRAAEIYARLSGKERKRPELRFGYAYAQHQLGDAESALAVLDGLEKQLPLLGREIRALTFEGKLNGEEVVRAAAHFEKRGDPRSLHKAAVALSSAGKRSKALAVTHRAISRADKSGKDELSAELRALRASLADPKKHKTLVLSDLRWLSMQAPEHPQSAGAARKLAELAKRPLSKHQRFERAMKLARAGDPEAVAAELEKLGQAPGAPVPAGELLHARAWAHYNSREYTRAAELFDEAVENSTQYTVKDSFYAARALSRAHSDDEAIVRYQALIEKYPRSAFAEHASYLIGHVELSLGRFNASAISFNRYLGNFKRGRFAKSARRELAVARLATGAYEKAMVGFSHLLAREKNGSLAARYRQLYAVALSGAGHTDKAVKELRRVIAERPLSLASLLARLRLKKLDEPEPAAWPEAEPARVFDVTLPPKVALLADIGVHVGAENALKEHEARLKAKYRPRSYEALCTAYGALEEAARRYQIGRQAAGYRFLIKSATPDSRWLWDCTYPRPFSGLVTDVAKQHGLREHLLYSVMRQESAFKVGAESWARASGLMQLIEPTARRVAAEIGISFDAADIRNPPKNVRLGAYYLAKLLGMFRGNVLLALAAYNAGPHAVSRWLESGEQLPLDIFIARVPYSETRGYLHHVMTNLQRYAYLAGDPLPEIKLEIEKDLRAPEDAY